MAEPVQLILDSAELGLPNSGPCNLLLFVNGRPVGAMGMTWNEAEMFACALLIASREMANLEVHCMGPLSGRAMNRLFEVSPAAARRIWDAYAEHDPGARAIWEAAAEPYPSESDRLRWLWSPHALLPEGTSPLVAIVRRRHEHVAALIDQMVSGAFV